MQETWLQSLGREDSLEGTATRSSILAWRVLWTETTVHRVTKSQTQLKWLTMHAWRSHYLAYTPPIHPTLPSADITNQCWFSSLDEVLDSSLVKFFMCDSWRREKETYLLSPHGVLSSQRDLISSVLDQRSQKHRWYLYSSQSICSSEMAWASQILSISLATPLSNRSVSGRFVILWSYHCKSDLLHYPVHVNLPIRQGQNISSSPFLLFWNYLYYLYWYADINKMHPTLGVQLDEFCQFYTSNAFTTQNNTRNIFHLKFPC